MYSVFNPVELGRGRHGALAGTISHKRSVGNKASIQAAHKDKTQSTPALVTDTTLVGFCKAAIKRFLAARAVSRGQAELPEGAVLEVQSSSLSWRESGTGCHPSQTQ